MKKGFVLHLVCAAAMSLVSFSALADWPDKTIKWVVPFGPGGANDLIARAAAEGVSKRLKTPIIIENKPGAGAALGADFVAKSKPDGYTFLIGAAGVVTNSILRKDMPYADGDLVPVGMIAVAPSVVVVHPSVPANDLKEFIAWTKTQKDGVNWSTAGTGSTPHFVSEMLKEAGANLNAVPYKSGSEGVTAVVANNVPATSEASIVVMPQVKAGKLKALANTYTKRMTAYPEVVTATEQGYKGVQIGHWAGLLAPKGTPQAIIDRMSKELEAALNSPETKAKLVPSGIETAPGTAADFQKFMAGERERLGKLALRAKMQAD